MDGKLVKEFVQCESDRRILFPYFKDRYAVLLLEHVIGDGLSIAELRRSQFAALLQKPAVKKLLAKAGSGQLTPKLLEYGWLDSLTHFVVTLDEFDGWAQTSRRGSNLVIQLNFASQHEHPYRRLMRPVQSAVFQGSSHPVRFSGRETLAWVRVDLDLDHEEALIEEVQSDWLRSVDRFMSYSERCGQVCCRYRHCFNTTLPMLREYHALLKPYRQIWAEAAVAAAVDYLVREVGVRRVFYHDFETGCRLKHIGLNWAPPRSLYTDLPKRFCMQRVTEGPSFLMRRRGIKKKLDKMKAPAFHCLEFTN